MPSIVTLSVTEWNDEWLSSLNRLLCVCWTLFGTKILHFSPVLNRGWCCSSNISQLFIYKHFISFASIFCSICNVFKCRSELRRSSWILVIPVSGLLACWLFFSRCSLLFYLIFLVKWFMLLVSSHLKLGIVVVFIRPASFTSKLVLGLCDM